MGSRGTVKAGDQSGGHCYSSDESKRLRQSWLDGGGNCTVEGDRGKGRRERNRNP